MEKIERFLDFVEKGIVPCFHGTSYFRFRCFGVTGVRKLYVTRVRDMAEHYAKARTVLDIEDGLTDDRRYVVVTIKRVPRYARVWRDPFSEWYPDVEPEQYVISYLRSDFFYNPRNLDIEIKKLTIKRGSNEWNRLLAYAITMRPWW